MFHDLQLADGADAVGELHGRECVNPRVTCRHSDNLTVVEQALGVER